MDLHSAYINTSDQGFELQETSPHLKGYQLKYTHEHGHCLNGSNLSQNQSKICPLCNHVSKTEEDFVAHSALHFSPTSQHSPRPLSTASANSASSSGTPQNSPGPLPNSVQTGK